MKKIILFATVFLAAALFTVAGDPATAPKSYQIRNGKFGGLLRPEDANAADGTRLVLYPAQPWKCMTWKLLPAGDSAFQLQNHFTHKTFAAKTNDATARVVQVPFARDAAQRPSWKLVKLSDGFYRIDDAASGKSLTAPAKDAVTLAPWEEKPEQKWELIETDTATLAM